MKTKIDRTKEQIIDRQKQRDKATTVFTKLYAKRRGRYKGWSEVLSETNPIENEIISKVSTKD